jgi:hypothetical protein
VSGVLVDVDDGERSPLDDRAAWSVFFLFWNMGQIKTVSSEIVHKFETGWECRIVIRRACVYRISCSALFSFANNSWCFLLLYESVAELWKKALLVKLTVPGTVVLCRLSSSSTRKEKKVLHRLSFVRSYSLHVSKFNTTSWICFCYNSTHRDATVWTASNCPTQSRYRIKNVKWAVPHRDRCGIVQVAQFVDDLYQLHSAFCFWKGCVILWEVLTVRFGFEFTPVAPLGNTDNRVVCAL